MTDKREQILEKIKTVLADIEGVQFVGRNLDQLPADKRPALLILDGDEEGLRDADGRNRGAGSPNRVKLKPEIYITMDSRKPQNKDLGRDLNLLRGKVIKALVFNVELTGLCENVFYAGAVSDLAKGREMLGQMGLAIEFTYFLKPADL